MIFVSSRLATNSIPTSQKDDSLDPDESLVFATKALREVYLSILSSNGITPSDVPEATLTFTFAREWPETERLHRHFEMIGGIPTYSASPPPARPLLRQPFANIPSISATDEAPLGN